jgi:hypothetical protein
MKARDRDALVVEFASDPPPLSPGAARAVLDMLLNACDKQAGNASEADDDGRQADGHMPAVPCEVPVRSAILPGLYLNPTQTPMPLNWGNVLRNLYPITYPQVRA